MMSLVGEATIDSPLFRETLDAVPEMTLGFEDIRSVRGDGIRFIVWATGGDFDAFEDALPSDPTVEEYRVLADVGDRRLYRLTLSAVGEESSTYVAATDEDIVLLDLTMTGDEARMIVRVPSREALRTYATVCRRLDIPFRLQRLYEEGESGNDDQDGHQFGLTDAQREALVRALEMGYFDVPRGASVDEIADELDVSGQAVSTLLRRGQTNLLRSTVAR